MAEPFLGEIRMTSFGFAPKGWARCEGQFLPINQNQALFALLGTTFGGNGQTTFALPDLRGRVPIHAGNSFTLGTRGGAASHTLTISEMPMHTHLVQATAAAATTNMPSNQALLAMSTAAQAYAPAGNLHAMAPDAVTNAGGSQAHTNMQPLLALNFCIALQGIFPSQN